MRTQSKTAFRPGLERVEPRVVATGGVVSAAAIHHVAPHHPAVHVASHHAAHPPKHQPSHPAKPPVVSPPTTTPHPAPVSPPVAPPPSTVANGTTNQAWVELVNMTGQNLEYQIKLGPYANGQFQTFDIGAGATQDRYTSLISNGQRVQADFAIQFGNGPVTPLETGISQSSARGYYIFMDTNFNYYVEPFIRS
jgi:hypothetical protein